MIIDYPDFNMTVTITQKIIKLYHSQVGIIQVQYRYLNGEKQSKK